MVCSGETVPHAVVDLVCPRQEVSSGSSYVAVSNQTPKIFLYMMSCRLQIVSFISSFLIWLPFFPCLIALVRISSIMLNKSDESGILVLFLIFREETPLAHH